MGAMKKKLYSRSGATLLMALLLLLVAVMVSTVIISAANTATFSLKTRRDNQQAYLTVSSAAEYLRDALLGEKGYSSSFVKHYKDEDLTICVGENVVDTTNRNKKSIVETVDQLLAQFMAGGTSEKLFISGITPTETYVLNYGDLDPVTMVLTMEEVDPQIHRYLLTAVFSTSADSEALCRMTLQMYCEINRKSTPQGVDKIETVTYQAVWNRDAAVILRQGMMEETS